ncbi:MAG: ATP-binding protein, partial [Chloroflexota bacterium]|nr:ATP-binding protein [Chloroflexota bacterium]
MVKNKTYAMQILDNGIQFKDGEIYYLWFKILDDSGLQRCRAVAFRELRSLALDKTEPEDWNMVGKQQSALRGLYSSQTDFVYSAMGIFKPKRVGVIQYYGAAGNGSTTAEAGAQAREGLTAVMSSLANFQQSQTRAPQKHWIEWYLEFITERAQKLSAVLGHPDPRDTRRLRELDGSLPFDEGDLAAEQTAQLFRGMAKVGKDFVFQVTAQQISREWLTEKYMAISRRVSEAASRQRGAISIGASISIPIMAALSNSLGQNEGAARSEARAVGEGDAHTWGRGASDGHTATDSETSTVGGSQTHTVSQSHTDSQSVTDGQSHSVTDGHSTTTSSSTSTSSGQSNSQSQGQSSSQSQGQSAGQSQGASQSESSSKNHSASHNQGVSGNVGVPGVGGVGYSEGVSEGYSASEGEASGQSQGSSQGQSSGQSQGQSSGQSQGQSSGKSTASGSSSTSSHSETHTTSHSETHGTADTKGVADSVSSMWSRSRGHSEAVSHQDSRQEGWAESRTESQSRGITSSQGGMRALTRGLSTGMVPGLNVGRSWQTVDAVAEDLTAALNQLRSHFNLLSRNGGFLGEVILFTEDNEAATAGEALIPQAFHGPNSPTPVLTVRDDRFNRTLREHAATFLVHDEEDPHDPLLGVLGKRFSTYLTAAQLAAYTAPAIFQEGTMRAMPAIPRDGMAFYPEMKG